MIYIKVPLRVSLCGGSSDLPIYFNHNHHGCVISTAIDKYIHIIADRSETSTYTITYNGITETSDYTPDNIKHDIIRTILSHFHVAPCNITILSDIDCYGKGLGSSSALTVGLIKLAYELNFRSEIPLSHICKQASFIEIDLLKGNLGLQDPYGCAYGGMKYIKFTKDKVSLEPFSIPEFNKHMFIVDTGKSHNTNENLKTLTNKLSQEQLFDINDHVSITDNLHNNSYSLKQALKLSWGIKLKNIQASEYMELYHNIIADAFNNGASACKLLGSGNGGYILFYADNVDETISKMPYKCFKINTDNEGMVCTIYKN